MRAFIVLFFAVLMMGTAHAQTTSTTVVLEEPAEPTGRWNEWSASVLGLYVIPDSGRNDIEYGAGMRLGISHPLTDRFDFEFNVFGNVLDRDVATGKDWQYGLGLDGLLYMSRVGPTPYLVFGGGAIYNEFATGSNIGAFANIGLGLKIRDIWEETSFRAEVRYHADWAGDGLDDTPYSEPRFFLGLHIPIFRTPAPATQVIQVTQPERVIVEEVIVEVERERVIEIIPPIQRLDGVTFAFDSAELDPNARVVLLRVAEQLNQYSDVTVEIAGHTDNVGSAAYNYDLSLRRANAVRTFLIAQGVAPHRITTRGYGFDQPVASNATEDGRRQNRRIEMRRTDL